ncbi:hypothetical protein BWI15_06065 [Kribbella sp. ALI-6-A]|uniref:hypothetical protein n=1 Tax=Kribbella sp. ALI-6-A TaxID=1933817 RepID=UPI00097BE795|nr:hypothetical protein [Kribbella sp. ALI-6-A]ONI75417.1 hypothetical protein BWI15_06065 [Kribbella sp. ALI-6-A]
MKITGEPAWRLVALLRLVEREPVEAGGEDVVLDAWFGPNSPGSRTPRPWSCLHPTRGPEPPLP